jgi:hypothetical protein
MKPIQLIIACLFIFTIVVSAGCDKVIHKVADLTNKVAKDSTGVLGKMDLGAQDTEGVSTVDGVKLKYTGIAIIKEVYKGNEFILDVSAASIDLTGIEAGDTDLAVTYKEYAEGDASFSIIDNSIKGKTKSGKPYLITNITGKIPRNLNLNIQDGAGTISLTSMQDNSQVILETGAGGISLDGCKIKKLITKTGAGGIALINSRIDDMEAKIGAGNITLKNTKITKRNFETGVGKVINLP